jgi:hypothetical protein
LKLLFLLFLPFLSLPNLPENFVAKTPVKIKYGCCFVPHMVEVVPFAAESAVIAASTCNPIIIAGACAFIGGCCLYQWLYSKQKAKKEANLVRRKLEQEQQNGVCGGPQKDPEKDKKKKNEKKPPREYTQKDYELLEDDKNFTKLSLEDREWLIRNEENIGKRKQYIRREAKRLGYRYEETADFDSRNQDVYKNGNTYITYDINGHKGGFWKMYRRGIKHRIGTYNLDLSICIGA